MTFLDQGRIILNNGRYVIFRITVDFENFQNGNLDRRKKKL